MPAKRYTQTIQIKFELASGKVMMESAFAYVRTAQPAHKSQKKCSLVPT